MEIGAVSFEPMIYNVNAVSGSSLGKVAPIPDSLGFSQLDYSDLLSESANENPLRKGETRGFMDVLAMQLQMGQQNASRLIPSSDSEGMMVEEIAENAPDMDPADGNESRDVIDMERANQASAFRNVSDSVDGVDTVHTVQGIGEDAGASMTYQMGNFAEFSVYRMNQAIDAYMSWMSA